jgi:hypothetical protein
MLERRIYFTTQLSIVVQDNFLSIEKKKKGVLVRLNCDELCKFVDLLAAEFDQPSFCIAIGDPLSSCSLYKDKIVHGNSTEEPILPLELIWFVTFLVKCLPHMVTSFVGVSCLDLFANYLVQKSTLKEGLACLNSLKLGRCDSLFESFVALHQPEEEKECLCQFLLFNRKLVKSILLLKCLFKKPLPVALGSIPTVSSLVETLPEEASSSAVSASTSALAN